MVWVDWGVSRGEGDIVRVEEGGLGSSGCCGGVGLSLGCVGVGFIVGWEKGWVSIRWGLRGGGWGA